jgi:hypothetical protein
MILGNFKDAIECGLFDALVNKIHVQSVILNDWGHALVIKIHGPKGL